MTDTLIDTVTETHDVLCTRLAGAGACRPTRDRPRELFTATDPFLASTSRHVGAATAVLARAARAHLTDGRARGHELSRQGRRLENALFQTKSKLYGSTFAIRRPWLEVWQEVEDELEAFWVLEQHLAEDLSTAMTGEECDLLAERLYRAERRVPTRPHPHLPHLGMSGRTSRAVAQRVDSFWDTAEGRMVPEPVRPHRTHEGRMTQYLLADPHIEEAS